MNRGGLELGGVICILRAAARRPNGVRQICNLLYRRFSTCRRQDSERPADWRLPKRTDADWKSAIRQTASLRYRTQAWSLCKPLTSRVSRRWSKALLLLSLGLSATALGAGESWPEALERMPLGSHAGELNRTNCVNIMLHAFQSNAVVKALIFMPGATDEFYMFRRARAVLTNDSPTLLDAVRALTNQTLIRATFKSPLMLLHTDEDPLEPDIVVQDQPTVERLRTTAFLPRLQCDDRDWDVVQPILKWKLKMDIRPWKNSADSWHFYRHSFVEAGVTEWEALETAALAGKSRFTVRRKQVVFEPDPRQRARPRFESNHAGH